MNKERRDERDAKAMVEKTLRMSRGGEDGAI